MNMQLVVKKRKWLTSTKHWSGLPKYIHISHCISGSQKPWKKLALLYVWRDSGLESLCKWLVQGHTISHCKSHSWRLNSALQTPKPMFFPLKLELRGVKGFTSLTDHGTHSTWCIVSNYGYWKSNLSLKCGPWSLWLQIKFWLLMILQ